MHKNVKTIIKTLHLLFACLWLGAATSVVLLQCLMGWSENINELATLNQGFTILDYSLIIPGAMGSALTGLWMCKSTNWGFTRYRWVIAKWSCTLVGILVGTALLGPWQMQMVKLTSRMGNTLITGASYDGIRILFTLVGWLQLILLVFTVAISVCKPWGKYLPNRKTSQNLETRPIDVRNTINEQ